MRCGEAVAAGGGRRLLFLPRGLLLLLGNGGVLGAGPAASGGRRGGGKGRGGTGRDRTGLALPAASPAGSAAREAGCGHPGVVAPMVRGLAVSGMGRSGAEGAASRGPLRAPASLGGSRGEFAARSGSVGGGPCVCWNQQENGWGGVVRCGAKEGVSAGLGGQLAAFVR